MLYRPIAERNNIRGHVLFYYRPGACHSFPHVCEESHYATESVSSLKVGLFREAMAAKHSTRHISCCRVVVAESALCSAAREHTQQRRGGPRPG